MKPDRTLIVAALAAAPIAALAQTTVTVYGRLDVSVDRVKSGSTTTWVQTDNASRLGFRGTEDLGGGFNAHFGLESGFNADTGMSPTTPTGAFYRNSYVGLQGDRFGAISLGRTDSANPAGSPIYTLVVANLGAAIHDAGLPAFGTKVLNARNRYNNSIAYKAPSFAGLTFRARVALNGDNLAGAPQEAEIRNYDASLNYQWGGLTLALAGSKDDYPFIAKPANSFDSKWMAFATYKLDAAKVYATYGRDKFNITSATRRDSVPYWMVGASGEFGVHGVTANLMQRAVQSDRNGQLKKWQVSYAYRFSKRTQVFALYDNEDPNSNVAANTIKGFSAGIQHNF